MANSFSIARSKWTFMFFQAINNIEMKTIVGMVAR